MYFISYCPAVNLKGWRIYFSIFTKLNVQCCNMFVMISPVFNINQQFGKPLNKRSERQIFNEEAFSNLDASWSLVLGSSWFGLIIFSCIINKYKHTHTKVCCKVIDQRSMIKDDILFDHFFDHIYDNNTNKLNNLKIIIYKNDLT